MIKRYNQFVETKTNEEFVFGNEPAKPEVTPDVKPGTTQPLPGEPDSPSPIRRDKPAVKPNPQAKVEDVVNRFMEELKKVSKPFNLDLKKLKQIYGNY